MPKLYPDGWGPLQCAFAAVTMFLAVQVANYALDVLPQIMSGLHSPIHIAFPQP